MIQRSNVLLRWIGWREEYLKRLLVEWKDCIMDSLVFPLGLPIGIEIWLVVWTPLKNMSQLGWWKQPNINGKIQHWWQPNHSPAIDCCSPPHIFPTCHGGHRQLHRIIGFGTPEWAHWAPGITAGTASNQVLRQRQAQLWILHGELMDEDVLMVYLMDNTS